MDNKKKAFIRKKLNEMDSQYWEIAVGHLSCIGKELDKLYSKQSEAFFSYTDVSFRIAETKYKGYQALLANELSPDEESLIEQEFKEKLKELEQKRQSYITQIGDLHNRLFNFTQQPFPLHNIREELKC